MGSATLARAAEKPRIRVDSYQIDTELVPKMHKLIGRARVTFTALEDISTAVFELHNALRPTKVVDANGNTLTAERVTQDSTIRIALPSGLSKGASDTLTISYEGTLASAEDSPVEGLKLAYIGDDNALLLYAGRWFPISGYGTNRFAADINITVPSGLTVIGSGLKGSGPATAVVSEQAPAAKPTRDKRGRVVRPAPAAPVNRTTQLAGKTTFHFVWDKPSFPGTIVAGNFDKFTASNVTVYFNASHKAQEAAYGDAALKAFEAYSVLYGPLPWRDLSLVELPDDTVPATWAPEIAGISGRAIQDKTNYKLVANSVAHQWWGASVSPAAKNDWWLSDGFAHFSEARYVEQAAGQSAYQEIMKDVDVGALAYDTVPLGSVGKLDAFSPEFQSLVTDKGAAILNMLRWAVGDEKFNATMRNFATQFAGKSATAEDFRNVAEQSTGEELTWFFTQWLNSTGAPEFKNKYTVYRMGNNKGFRIVGQISQDLDLFRMPVDLKIDTDGKTEMKRIDVVGTESAYAVETFGKPRRITIDPESHVLKNSPDLKTRVAILRGNTLVEQGDLAEALKEFNKALEQNKNSSLAHYRIAEVFFQQHNYQASANEYRESIDGDADPAWTVVWSHIQLGKIFDLTGQRERAVNEYRQALNTNDNTSGALEEARKYLQAPYHPEKKDNSEGE